MPPFSRRSLIGTTAGLVAVATPALAEPRELLGAVAGDKVMLPRLHAETDVEGPPPNPDPAGRRLGIAVVGLGHLALAEILPAFGAAKHVKVTALVSGEPDKARTVAAQYGVPESGLYDYAGFDRLRDNPGIDIVYIVLPNAMHAEFTVRAAQAGKHVLCEKPMATNVADAERMVTACRDAGRKLMIAYRCQYEPHHRALIAAVRDQRYGPVRLIEAVNGQNDLPNQQWRQDRAMAGGGSLPDVGLYCLNAARYLTGEEPVQVTATINQPKDDPRFREIEDVCAFTLRFPSGIVAACSSGYSFHESRQLRVMARDAWMALDPAFSYDGITRMTGRRDGLANAVQQERFAHKNQFALEMDHFAEAIRAGREAHTPGEEGVQDHKLMAAIYQAAAGGSTVKLPQVVGLDTTRGPPPAVEG
jgi:predicted dehydrogenase